MQSLHGRLTAYLVYRLGPRQERATRAALAAGKQVVCVSADPEIAESLGRVRVLPEGALPGFVEGSTADGAFDLVESVVASLVAHRPGIVGPLRRLAGGDEELRCYLSRWLLRTVAALHALGRLVSSEALAEFERIEVDAYWPGGADIALVAAAGRTQLAERSPAVADVFERISFAAGQRRLGARARVTADAVRAAAMLWRDWLPRVRRRSTGLEKRALLLRHYGEDWGLDRGGQSRLRNFDFVVDGETIRSSDVAILAEDTVPETRDAELRNRGYAVIRDPSVTVGVADFAFKLVPDLVRATALLLRLATAESWWLQPTRTLAREGLLWGEVGRRVRPRVLLLYNDLHPAGLARTLTLRRSGCRAVAYEYSCSWLFDEHGWLPDFVFAFDVADAVATWGALHSENVMRHRGLVGECWEVGCLWSEHARRVREEAPLRDRYRSLVEEATGVELAAFARIVAVFDASVDPHLLDYDDMAAFYEGVVSVARAMPDALFLCKPKRPIDTVYQGARAGDDLADAIAGTPNVVLLPELFETAAVVGLADLSVNVCFTSTGVETIGSDSPAIYFDPTQRFPDAFFRKVPGFVATSADELVARVRELLAQPRDSRERDLRAWFVELEGHFDGRAITRFRERLAAVVRP